MTKNKQSGFSLPEIFIVIVTTSMLVVLFSAFIVNFWSYSMYQQADLDSLVERLNTSDYLRENLGSSNGLITQNSIPDANVHIVDPQDITGFYWAPLHAVPNTTSIGNNNEILPILYYSKLSTSNDNNVIKNGNINMSDEYVLYLDSATKQLKVRTIINPATSSTNKRKTTCPNNVANNDCPKDTVLISDVQSIEKRFFSRSGNLLDWTSIYDPDINAYIGPDNETVEVIELTINVSKKAIFQKSETTKNSTIIRVALRNT